jgi:hypothetical protein
LPAIRSPESIMTIDGVETHPSITTDRIVAAVEASRRSLDDPASVSAAAPKYRAWSQTPASTNASPVASPVSTAPRNCCSPSDEPTQH